MVPSAGVQDTHRRCWRVDQVTEVGRARPPRYVSLSSRAIAARDASLRRVGAVRSSSRASWSTIRRTQSRSCRALKAAGMAITRSPTRRSDASLAAIARELSDTYLGGRARPTSVSWSTRQQRRWGSCTPAEGTIRLSSRLQGMPDWVLRSVVMHELVHLLVPGHGPEFYALMGRYPKAERARGFLDGVSWAADLPQGIDEPEEGHDPQEGPGPSLELEEPQIPVR